MNKLSSRAWALVRSKFVFIVTVIGLMIVAGLFSWDLLYTQPKQTAATEVLLEQVLLTNKMALESQAAANDMRRELLQHEEVIIEQEKQALANHKIFLEQERQALANHAIIIAQEKQALANHSIMIANQDKLINTVSEQKKLLAVQGTQLEKAHADLLDIGKEVLAAVKRCNR